MLKKYLSKFPHALNGLRDAFINDFGFRSQLYLGVFVAFIVLLLIAPLETTETLLIVLAYVLVLITELQNSALEAALDQIHPEKHHSIKKSKDMAAGAVLLAGLFLLTTLILIGLDTPLI